jgi:hypothetical protein
MNWLRGDAVWVGVVYWIAVAVVIVLPMAAFAGQSRINAASIDLLIALFFTGFWQLLYAVPLFLWLRTKRPRSAKGVMIASAIAFGITGVCTVVVPY